MNFAWIIKVLSEPDKYLSDELMIVDRPEGVIAKYEQQARRARKKFGENWQQMVQILEVDWTEFAAYNGRKGGRRLTRDKRQHLKNISQMRSRRIRLKKKKPSYYRRKPGPKIPRGPKPRRSYSLQWWTKGTYAVCARSIGLANRYVRRLDKSVRPGELRRSWLKKQPEGIKHNRIGVYGFTQNQWKQLL